MQTAAVDDGPFEAVWRVGFVAVVTALCAVTALLVGAPYEWCAPVLVGAGCAVLAALAAMVISESAIQPLTLGKEHEMGRGPPEGTPSQHRCLTGSQRAAAGRRGLVGRRLGNNSVCVPRASPGRHEAAAISIDFP